MLSHDGTVTVAVPSLPTNFNPATIAGSTQVTDMVMSEVWPQTFVLNNFNAPQCPESVAAICEGLLSGNNPAELVSNSPQTVVYHISSAATWSDGVEITAADFSYNWKMQLQVGSDLPASDPIGGYRDISSVTGSGGGKTVTVVFSKPFADWQSLFTNLVPAHIAKDATGWNTDFATFDPKMLVSGGPFEIEQVIPGEKVILQRNPHYWGPQAGVAKIVFKVEATQSATLRALANGDVDMASLIPGPQVDNTVAASTNLIESTQPGSTMLQLDFNLVDPTTSNLNLREAIAETIDRHQIVSNTVGLMTPFNNVAANHLFPYGLQGSQPNDSAFELVNLAQAETQLADAGYPVGTDGVARDSLGHPLVLSLIGANGNAVVSGIELEIQSELLQIGVEVTISNIPNAQLLGTTLPQGAFQMAIAPYFMSQFLSTNVQLYTDPVNPSITGSTAALAVEPAAVAAGVVTRDVLGYQNPQVVKLFGDASRELNAGSINTYDQVDTAIWADLPSLPLFQMPVSYVSNARVLNDSNSQGWLGPMWNAQNWTIQSSPVPTTSTTLAN